MSRTRLSRHEDLRTQVHPAHPGAPGSHRCRHPRGEGIGQCPSQFAAVLYHRGGRAHLADHRRHPGLSKDGERHALRPRGGHGQRCCSQALDQLRQATPSGGLVGVARVERARAAGLVWFEVQTEERLDAGLIGHSGLNRAHRVQDWDDQSA